MHKMTVGVLGIAIGLSTGMTLFGQAPRAERIERGAAPTDKGAYFFAKDIRTDVEALVKGGTSRSIGMMEGGHFSLNLVHRVGKEQPQWHKEEVDLYIIQSGTATIVTGGELVGPIETAQDGDKRGASIKGGVLREVVPGDVVFIPPGVAHQGIFNDAKGVTYLNIHFPGHWPPAK